MARGLPAIALVAVALILALPALAPMLAHAQTVTQVPLQADIENGITIWQGLKTLYKKGAGPHDNTLVIVIGGDDVRVIRQWPGDVVYVVLKVVGIDTWAGKAPLVRVWVGTAYDTQGSNLYVSSWVMVTNPGIVEIPISKDVFDNQMLDNGAKIVVELYPFWSTDPNNNAPDTYYSVTIQKIVIAPEKGAATSNTIPMAADWADGPKDRKMTYVALGLGGLALVLALVGLFGRGRRIFAVVPVMALAAASMAGLAVAHAMTEDMTSVLVSYTNATVSIINGNLVVGVQPNTTAVVRFNNAFDYGIVANTTVVFRYIAPNGTIVREVNDTAVEVRAPETVEVVASRPVALRVSYRPAVLVGASLNRLSAPAPPEGYKVVLDKIGSSNETLTWVAASDASVWIAYCESGESTTGWVDIYKNGRYEGTLFGKWLDTDCENTTITVSPGDVLKFDITMLDQYTWRLTVAVKEQGNIVTTTVSAPPPPAATIPKSDNTKMLAVAAGVFLLILVALLMGGKRR